MKATFTHCLLIATTAFLITGFSAQHLLNNAPKKSTQNAMQIAPTTEQIQQVVIIGKRMNTIEKAEYDALQKQTKAQWAEASIRASNNLK